MIYFMQGLLFGLAYVMPIGIQNMYVINSAMQRNLTYSPCLNAGDSWIQTILAY